MNEEEKRRKKLDARQKYAKEKYDQFKILIPKGMREQLNEVIEASGMSKRQWTLKLFQNEIEKYNEKTSE